MFLGQTGFGFLIEQGNGVYNVSTVLAAIVTTMLRGYMLGVGHVEDRVIGTALAATQSTRHPCVTPILKDL
jgi:ABC-type nitrate/sulfonate/bicarbonate transport system permease component